jgi:delta-aminolevulinic acid dehydratase/porphobilinogen synthase
MSKKADKINRERQEEYKKLLATLRELSIDELLLLYIEAKTGSQEDIDKLPVSYLETLEDLGEMLNKFYADRLLNSLFTK